ncbi:MAG TPA: SAM-dependent methyltransferase [Acidobacteriota bacterium]|jgi:hypothetical protein
MSATQLYILPSSFRDPAGYVFIEDKTVKRAVTFKGKANYDLLMSSGLYDRLVDNDWMVRHQEESRDFDPVSGIYKTILPEQLDYISYPYEWSFSQLQDAALLTLQIQMLAMKHGMSLKDASSFNVQFRGPHPVFIDTLSFQENKRGPWIAYDQFCRHFLAPLLLMSNLSPNFNQFLKASLDGFPLDLTSTLLPLRTYLQFGPLIHLHLHARTQKKYASAPKRPNGWAIASPARDPKPAIIESLVSTIESQKLRRKQGNWINYYRDAHHYSPIDEEFKKSVVSSTLKQTRPACVYDLGGNTGNYSRLATAQGIRCVCYDFDPLCVNENYLQSKARNDLRMLPLLMDLNNPSPGLGFDSCERLSFIERPKPDLVFALAILHHLRITGNVPLRRISQFFAKLTRWLLIEFIPKQDEMAMRLLQGREDVFDDYSLPDFYRIFGRYFRLQQVWETPDNRRLLCLFENRT